MIVAINYADKNFRDAQKFNTKTAYSKGKVDKVIEYSPNDIDEKFYSENRRILNHTRGGGYWLWKPYIILKTMETLNDGDYLFYCDAGAYYINKVEYLIKSLNDSKQDIMPFDLPLIESQWTKSNTFEILQCNNEVYKNTNQRLATYILIKVNQNSKNFIKEYLEYCKQYKCLVDDDLDKNANENLISHRHDQSIFSLLSKKYKLDSFRDPSQYGIRPWEYLSNDRMYNPIKHKNSKYPQILVSQRKANIKIFRVKEFFKRHLTKMKVLTEDQFKKKNNIKCKFD